MPFFAATSCSCNFFSRFCAAFSTAAARSASSLRAACAAASAFCSESSRAVNPAAAASAVVARASADAASSCARFTSLSAFNRIEAVLVPWRFSSSCARRFCAAAASSAAPASRLRRGERVGQLLYVRQIALAFHPRYGLELVGASLRLQRRILREAQLERRRC